MVFIRLIISFLLMFILPHLSDCCSTAHTRQDVKKTVAADHDMIGIEVVRRSSQNVDQVFEDGFPSAAEVDRTSLRGRKMMSEKRLSKDITKEQVCTISGKGMPALKKPSGISSPEQLKVQKRSNSEEHSLHQESDTDNSFQNPEPQKFADAANEIVKLMNVDYTPGGVRHKPPIHNNEPLKAEHTLP